jgi:hypothetical protein
MNIGSSELVFILFIAIAIPVGLLILAYRLGKQAGENKILKRLDEERRSERLL